MKERYVIVTGAVGAIGASVTTKFLACEIGVIAIDKLPFSDVAHSRLKFLQCDLGKVAECSNEADKLYKNVIELVGEGSLVGLINNAALQDLAPTMAITRESWHATLNINLNVPLFLTQLFLRDLEASRGSVVNIGSIHSKLTKPKFVAYATSKAGLAGLTRAMAVDLAGSVAVNCIEPAAIDTEMLREGFSGDERNFNSLAECHPSGRIGSTQEVAELAYFLTTTPGFINGAVIGVDGGISGRLHDPQ